MRLALILKIGLCSSAIFALGCQATLVRRPALPTLGTQGGAWEAALPSAATTAALGTADYRQFPEYSRNDLALNPRPVQARLATRQWPEDPRPSLARARRLQLETRADQVLFFEPEAIDRSERHQSGWNWWW